MSSGGTENNAPDTPALPTLQPESPRYYGWVMLPVASVMIIATLPGQTVIVSQFNTPIRESLGLSAIALSEAYFLGTMLAALPQALLGKLSDRIGPRRGTALVVMAFALGMLVLANARGLAAITLGFFLVRLLGQGALGMLSSHVLALWFERRLATVESIKHACMALAGVIAPIGVVALIEARGWRESYAILAVIVAGAVLPLVATVFRDRPEQIGQHLDNEPPDAHAQWRSARRAHQAIVPVFTLGQALASRAYWLLLVPSVFSGLVGTAMLFHIQPILTEKLAGGLAATDAETVARGGAQAVAFWSGALFVGLVVGGPIADRFPTRSIMPMATLGLALSAGILAASQSAWQASLAMAVFGVAQGILMSTSGPAVARFFGRPHHGAIRGFMTTVMVAGTGIGPLALTTLAELLGGSFAFGLWLFAAASVPIAAASALIRRPIAPHAA
ncbi:MAG: MFS transporter [Planctomycetota bacterium]